MAYSATYNVTIRAPQAKVCDHSADVSRHGEWATDDDHMRVAAEKSGTIVTKITNDTTTFRLLLE